MQSGTLAETSALDLFLRLTKEAATGLLEVSDGKKKRSFYLSSGDLQYTRSNLRSESVQALKAKHPKLDNRRLANLQANIRIMNCVGLGEGAWTFAEDEEPPKILPLSLLSGLWTALLERVDDADLLGRLEPYLEEHPEVDFAGPYEVTDLPVGPELGSMLHELDGRRSLQEILDFAPGEVGHALRAIVLAHGVGIARLEGGEVSTSVEATVRTKPVPDVQVELYDDERTDLDFTEQPDGDQPVDSHEATLGIGRKKPSGGGVEISSMIADALGDRVAATDPELKRLQTQYDRIQASENHFEVIGVEWDATDEEYRRAYFELARRYHPDAWSDRPMAQVEMVERIIAAVNEAWEVVGTAEGREPYVNSVIHGIKSEDELAMEKVQAIFAAEERFKVGLRALQASKLVEAHDIFQEIVEAVPEEHEFRAHLGYTIFRLHYGKDDDRADGGRDLIKAAIDAVAKMDAGYVLLGQTYALEGKPEVARKCYIRALKQNPSNPDAHREMKRLERAREEQERREAGFFKNLFGGKKKGKGKKGKKGKK